LRHAIVLRREERGKARTMMGQVRIS
jgi:hypothetical protein